MNGPSVPFVRLDVTGVDDPEAGVAAVLYVAGCSLKCPGCQNPELQDPNSYPLMSVPRLIEELERFFSNNEAFALVEAVVFQGGDWMEYPISYHMVAKWVRERGLRTVLYTGRVFENLPECAREVSDWVVDGPWRQEAVSLFPASTNQRVFHQGQRVDPEQLPLYKHLLESRSAESDVEERGGLG